VEINERSVALTGGPVSTFLDPFWDYGARDLVERELLTRFQRQVSERASHTRYFAQLRVTAPPEPLTRSELETLPLISKRELRAQHPDDLLVDPGESFHMVRGTGGTTGLPLPIAWTRDDWRASTHAMRRFCVALERSRPRRIWNAYNQGHVSGPAFDDLARALGATPIPRHFRASDEQAIEELERVRPDALVITPRSGSGKGGSLEDLLAVDPNLLARLNVRALLVSSTRLEADLLDEVREQGVRSIVNFYGSTEGPPAAISCEIDPGVFHLAQGHVLIEIVDERGNHVDSGQRGRVVLSRIGSETESALAPAGGTQLIRYLVGDSALFLDEPCTCGRSSARIADIVRISDLEDKLRGGCERWE
jgi:phenylacetate-CoA ligase